MNPEPNTPPFTYTDITPIVLTPTPTPTIAVSQHPQIHTSFVPTLSPVGAILFALGLVAAALLVIWRKP